MYSLNARSERLLLALLAMTQFTIIMDFMVMMPLGAQIMRSFHVTPTGFATAVSAYSWCSGLSALFAATYIDRFDRRRLLLFVYALFALSNLACALSPSFAVLWMARAFAGITGGVLGSVVMAIIGDVIPPMRRGAATGTIMMAFSLASVAGVPAGVLLGAHFGWFAPFVLLTLLSVLAWLAAFNIVPLLGEHLRQTQPTFAQVLPALWGIMSNPRHATAYLLTFFSMAAQMVVIPFIAPVLVANHGVAPANLSWIYMVGGAATFVTARVVGKLTDAYGSHRVYRVLALLAILPVMLVTHLPQFAFGFLLLCMAFFMVIVSARMIPLQTLMTKVPEPMHRGAFLSTNSAVQALGVGCGAWGGGLFLHSSPDGTLVGYQYNGWLAFALLLFATLWVGRVKVTEKSAATASTATATSTSPSGESNGATAKPAAASPAAE